MTRERSSLVPRSSTAHAVRGLRCSSSRASSSRQRGASRRWQPAAKQSATARLSPTPHSTATAPLTSPASSLTPFATPARIGDSLAAGAERRRPRACSSAAGRPRRHAPTAITGGVRSRLFPSAGRRTSPAGRCRTAPRTSDGARPSPWRRSAPARRPSPPPRADRGSSPPRRGPAG